MPGVSPEQGPSGLGNPLDAGPVGRAMSEIATLLNEGDPLIAVVGATDDPTKYGATIYRDLKRKGYRVVAVNDRRDRVDGDPAYRDLRSLPERPDIVDIVVPPASAAAVVEDGLELGLERFWLQPGAESPAIVERLVAAGVDHLVNACIMTRSRVRRGDGVG